MSADHCNDELPMPITLQVIAVIKNINSALLGPSSSWAPMLCTCCTVHCYATGVTYIAYSTSTTCITCWSRLAVFGLPAFSQPC